MYLSPRVCLYRHPLLSTPAQLAWAACHCLPRLHWIATGAALRRRFLFPHERNGHFSA